MQGHGLCVSSTERVERIQSITCDYLDPAIIMLIIEELKIHHVFSGKYVAYSTKIDLLDYALIVFCLSGPTIKHLGQNPQPSPSPNIPLYSDISSPFITSPQTISSLPNITVPVRGPSLSH